MTRADRRLYQRAYARRKREARLAVARRTADRCPKRWGNHPCGGPLHTGTDGNGHTVVTCAWCERHARGFCRDCPQPVRGRSKRCPTCKRRAIRASIRRSAERHRDEYNARGRARLAAMDPVEHVRRNMVKAAWRRLNPDKVRAQKRREVRRRARPIGRYQARYKARYREHYRRLALARYYRLHPRRPTPTCGCGRAIVWTGRGRPPTRCLRCVPPCLRRARQAALGRHLQRFVAEVLAPQPRKLRAPTTTYILGDGRHRCCGAGCQAALEGRAKKCAACKARDRADAQHMRQALVRRRWLGKVAA